MTLHDGAPRFRIGTVASLTGVSTHLLRAWERRYGAVVPRRSPRGGRLYGAEEVARVRRLKTLTEMGHSISQLAPLSDNELDKLLTPVVQRPTGEPDYTAELAISHFFEAIEGLDPLTIELSLSRASLAFEPLELATRVLIPALHEVGRRWEVGTISAAQEHAATAAVRTQLGALLRLYRPNPAGKRAVATTMSGELHELGALSAALAAVSCGWHVVYLGPNLPVPDIVRGARIAKADVVLLSAVTRVASLNEMLVQLRSELPMATALVTGGPAASAPSIEGIIELDSVAELAEWLTRYQFSRA